MLIDLINLEKARRAIIYFGIILVVMLLQDTVLSCVPIFGVRAFIAPIVVVAIGYFESGVWGGVFGLILGFLCDIDMNDSPILLTVVFPIIGFFAGSLAMFFFNKRFFSFFFVSLAALAITALCQILKFIVFADTNMLPLFTAAGLQTLWSLPFTLAIFYPCRAVSGADLSK